MYLNFMFQLTLKSKILCITAKSDHFDKEKKKLVKIESEIILMLKSIEYVQNPFS